VQIRGRVLGRVSLAVHPPRLPALSADDDPLGASLYGLDAIRAETTKQVLFSRAEYVQTPAPGRAPARFLSVYRFSGTKQDSTGITLLQIQ
jgi:hypothetical protein